MFQKRFEGSVDFYRYWNDYKSGFGDVDGEFWLGLDKIYRLTSDDNNMLRVDLEDFDGDSRYAEYNMFGVTSESDKYRLNIGSYSGTAGNSLAYQNGQRFTTQDQDNDGSDRANCAVKFKGAWWYNACHRSNLNCAYHHGPHSSRAVGVNWSKFRGFRYSLKRTEMKIRPMDF